jgi:hypothetical protein
MAFLQVSPLGGSRDGTWRGQEIRKCPCLGISHNWVNCDGAMEVSDHVPHRTTYRQNNSGVVHEIPLEWLPVCFAAHKQPLHWNFMYHSRIVLSVGGSVWYVVWNLRCTVTIDSVLANSKTQNAFLFPVHAMFWHDCPPSGEMCKYAMSLSTQTKFERFSTYWYALLRRDLPGYCTAEFGNPGGAYELPCSYLLTVSLKSIQVHKVRGLLFICTLLIDFFGVWCKAISKKVLILQHVVWWCSRLRICVWKHMHFVTFEVLWYWGSQDSIVAIALCYRLDSMGLNSWWEQYFLDPSRLAPTPTQPLAQWVPVHFPGGTAVGVRHWPPTTPF